MKLLLATRCRKVEKHIQIKIKLLHLKTKSREQHPLSLRRKKNNFLKSTCIKSISVFSLL